MPPARGRALHRPGANRNLGTGGHTGRPYTTLLPSSLFPQPPPLQGAVRLPRARREARVFSQYTTFPGGFPPAANAKHKKAEESTGLSSDAFIPR